MAKTFGKEKADVRTTVVFSPVTKEFGEEDQKKVLTLKFDQVTGRFDLFEDGKLVVSSMVLGDCVKRAEERGIVYSEQEKKITLKVVV